MRAELKMAPPGGGHWTDEGVRGLMGQQFPVMEHPAGPSYPVEVVAVCRSDDDGWVVVTVEGPRIPHSLVQHGDPRWS